MADPRSPKTVKTELRAFPAFADVPPEELNWLVEQGRCTRYPQGSYLFREGDEADRLIIVLQGRLRLFLPVGNELRETVSYTRGEITGILPYSRMQVFSGRGLAAEELHVLEVDKTCFPALTRNCYHVTRVLVQQMTTRTRDFQRSTLQDEKLRALGKLSAGLAHELNNPAAAIRSSANTLQTHLNAIAGNVYNIMQAGLPLEAIHQVQAFINQYTQQPAPYLPMMKRAEREDELAEWMEDHGIEAGFDFAPEFVQAGLTVSELQQLLEPLPRPAWPYVCKWLNISFTSDRLLTEVQEAGGRISGIVAAVKSYTHMDRSRQEAQVNLLEGIQATLKILEHKFRQQDIDLELDLPPDLPPVPGIPGELNQVWTNLLDNALDALPEQGPQLVIRGELQDEYVCIGITDNGSGIPQDIQGRIFEPFFTTKSVGSGTGLGLDIVKRIVENHGGKIEVRSAPGNTQFRVLLPLAATGAT